MFKLIIRTIIEAFAVALIFSGSFMLITMYAVMMGY